MHSERYIQDVNLRSEGWQRKPNDERFGDHEHYHPFEHYRLPEDRPVQMVEDSTLVDTRASELIDYPPKQRTREFGCDIFFLSQLLSIVTCEGGHVVLRREVRSLGALRDSPSKNPTLRSRPSTNYYRILPSLSTRSQVQQYYSGITSAIDRDSIQDYGDIR